MLKIRNGLFTVQLNFQGEEEENSQKIFYQVLRDVHRTVWQLGEKVSQLSTSFSHLSLCSFHILPLSIS